MTLDQVKSLLKRGRQLALFKHVHTLATSVERAGGCAACDKAGLRWIQVTPRTILCYMRGDTASESALKAFLYTMLPPPGDTMFMSDEDTNYIQIMGLHLCPGMTHAMAI
jgi:hypothetical protein